MTNKPNAIYTPAADASDVDRVEAIAYCLACIAWMQAGLTNTKRPLGKGSKNVRNAIDGLRVAFQDVVNSYEAELKDLKQ